MDPMEQTMANGPVSGMAALGSSMKRRKRDNNRRHNNLSFLWFCTLAVIMNNSVVTVLSFTTFPLPTTTTGNGMTNRVRSALDSESMRTDSQSQRTWNRSRYSRQRPEPKQRGSMSKKTKPMPVVGYDADRIMDFYDRRPLQVGWRLNTVGLPLLGECCLANDFLCVFDSTALGAPCWIKCRLFQDGSK